MLILGTKSKRRIDLLSHFSIPFEVIGSDFDESSVPEDLPVNIYVEEIALGKANVLARKFKEYPILTLDTTVYLEGKIYNKPFDHKHALEMLTNLQGKAHEVWTGVVLRKNQEIYKASTCTKVYFHPLTQTQIEMYLQSIDYLDKAGSYAIQDAGGLLIEKIEGDFYNVIGFPLALVQKLLLHVDIDLWHYLKTSPLPC